MLMTYRTFSLPVNTDCTGKSSEINVVKVNLTNFVLVKNVKTVDLDFGTGFSQDIVSSLAYSYDNPPVLYAALGHGEKLFAVDLNSLAVVAGYPASSIPSLPGFVTSSPVSTKLSLASTKFSLVL